MPTQSISKKATATRMLSLQAHGFDRPTESNAPMAKEEEIRRQLLQAQILFCHTLLVHYISRLVLRITGQISQGLVFVSVCCLVRFWLRKKGEAPIAKPRQEFAIAILVLPVDHKIIGG